MEQHFSRAGRFVIPETGGLVYRDIASNEPELAFLDSTIGLIERAFAVSEAFNFASSQDQPAFDRFDHLKSMSSLTVLGDHSMRRASGGILAGLGFCRRLRRCRLRFFSRHGRESAESVLFRMYGLNGSKVLQTMLPAVPRRSQASIIVKLRPKRANDFDYKLA